MSLQLNRESTVWKLTETIKKTFFSKKGHVPSNTLEDQRILLHFYVFSLKSEEIM